MTILDFITKYWAQITIFFSLITTPFIYFTKRYFDNQNKLLEIKQSLHQELKLAAIQKFIEAYTELENFYWQVPYFEVVERKILPKELDDMQLPLYNRFISSYYSLFLVLNKSEIDDFDKIKEEISKTKYALGQLYDYFDEDNNKTIRTNNYHNSYDSMMRNNKQILLGIGDKVRKMYTS